MGRLRGLRRPVRNESASITETPQKIAGLAAWFDSRTDAWFTLNGSAVSAWASRSGSLGSIAFTQATSNQQPTRATAVSSFNSQNAIQFDGSDDQLVSNSTNALKFMHDGTGGTAFLIRRFDSTGGAAMQILTNDNNTATNVGFVYYNQSTPSTSHRLHNGSGTNLNVHAVGSGARDATAWEAISYITGTSTIARSGVTDTSADTGGQSPSSSNPTYPLAIGGQNTSAGSNPFKGYVAQLLFYTRVLSATERTLLATWANTIYGTAA